MVITPLDRIRQLQDELGLSLFDLRCAIAAIGLQDESREDDERPNPLDLADDYIALFADDHKASTEDLTAVYEGAKQWLTASFG